MLTKIEWNISALHNLDLPPLVKGGQLILITSPGRGGNSEKLKKGGGSMVQGQFFLKGRGWYFYLIIQGLSFLNLEITLSLVAKLHYTLRYALP